jgi:hypothetical protein
MRGVFTRTPPGRRHASRERRRLRCLTLLVGTTANGQRLTCEPRCRARQIAHPPRVSRASAARPGTQGYTSGLRFAILALGPGSRSARASALAALVRDTRARLIRCLLTSPTAPPAPGNAAGCAPRARRNVLAAGGGLAARGPNAAPRHATRIAGAAAIHQRPRPVFFLLFTMGPAGLHPSRAVAESIWRFALFRWVPDLVPLVRDTRAGQLRGASRCRVPAERASARAGTQGRHDALLPSAYGIAECGDDMRYGLIGVSGRYPGR